MAAAVLTVDDLLPNNGGAGAVAPVIYPAGMNLSREVLADLNNGLDDVSIIDKLRSLPDLYVALWGEDTGDEPRYCALHHAASRGREELLRFILSNARSNHDVNIINDNYFTALRYARRNNHGHIEEILLQSGAVESHPPLQLQCANGECAKYFLVPSEKQHRFEAMQYVTPKYCSTNCRDNVRQANARARGIELPPPRQQQQHYEDRGNWRVSREERNNGFDNSQGYSNGYGRGGYGGRGGGAGGYREHQHQPDHHQAYSSSSSGRGGRGRGGGYGGGRGRGGYQSQSGGQYEQQGNNYQQY